MNPNILARELTKVPDDVRDAPAPAIPVFAEPFHLRPVDLDSDDPERIAEWMTRPHLVETWEQPWTAERRRANCAAQLAGTYSRPCILSYDFAADDGSGTRRRDVAYIEFYRSAKDEVARLYTVDPFDVGFHIATADQNLVGRGIMSGWIGLLPAAVWAADPHCRRIMGDPDYRNTRTRRALVKNGWIDLGELDVRPDRRIALHARPRTPGDLPDIRN
ncbi:GNAT family N-acetyltransferase [Nocardia thraciensis]